MCFIKTDRVKSAEEDELQKSYLEKKKRTLKSIAKVRQNYQCNQFEFKVKMK